MKDEDLKDLINAYLDSRIGNIAKKEILKDSREIASFTILQGSYDTIKVQLIALGLIKQSDKKRGVKDTATYWTLTPYGHTLMTQLKAIKMK